MQFAFAYAPPVMISTAIELGVFDALDSGPKTLDELATTLRASERGLRMLVNALAGFELLVKDGDRYSLTPESGAFLVSSKPAYYGGLFRNICSDHIPTWLRLKEAIQTGRAVRDVTEESQSVEFFQDFVASLFQVNYAPAQALAKALLPAIQSQKPARVLDLAAGSGVWGIALAQQSPEVQVTAVDWEGVLPVTRKTAARFGLENRFSFVPGDMLKVDFGGGYTVAIIGHILHGIGAKDSQTLIRKVASALAPGGTIAIAEYLVNIDRTGPPPSLVFAVNMLLFSAEGDTFSFEEISGWLRGAGLENARLVEAPGPSPLILATKPG
jgi:3-hydroxy-5-methyl-1-naphthoate 3-O-methyltransferase